MQGFSQQHAFLSNISQQHPCDRFPQPTNTLPACRLSPAEPVAPLSVITILKEQARKRLTKYLTYDTLSYSDFNNV
jgi:hypothetical protein